MKEPQYTEITTPRSICPDFLESARDDFAPLHIGDDAHIFWMDRSLPSTPNDDGTWTTTLTWHEPTES